MPVLDLTRAQALRLDGRDAQAVRLDGVDLWTKPAPPTPGWREDQFVVTFVTTAPGQAANLYLGGCGAGNVMDWGDGAVETLSAGTATAGSATRRQHTYAEPGVHQAVYTGTFTTIGSSLVAVSIMAPLVSVDWWGGETGTTAAAHGLRSAENLTYVAPPPSTLTTMANLLRGATAYTGLVPGPGGEIMADWYTAACTDMTGMLSGASAVQADLSGWAVPLIPTRPSSFAAAGQVIEPVWGTWGRWPAD